ncbi:MAG TPA: hypothetical protein VKV15_22620 [Bryobacteraceae bacterium]|nr:hypothetical protein [Bryobacteraceae bacterium]
MTRYTPSRHYFSAGFVALGLAVFSAWCGFRWAPAFIPAGLFILSSALLLFLALRPPVEICDTHVKIGKLVVPWSQVRRVDRTGWVSPLVLHITLADSRRFLLVYPGDLDSAHSLLRCLRRYAREALIDGIPYRQFWGENLTPEAKPLASPRYPLLRPDDEDEVERMFQRLKTVGHLDPKNSSDEK